MSAPSSARKDGITFTRQVASSRYLKAVVSVGRNHGCGRGNCLWTPVQGCRPGRRLATPRRGGRSILPLNSAIHALPASRCAPVRRSSTHHHASPRKLPGTAFQETVSPISLCRRTQLLRYCPRPPELNDDNKLPSSSTTMVLRSSGKSFRNSPGPGQYYEALPLGRRRVGNLF